MLALLQSARAAKPRAGIEFPTLISRRFELAKPVSVARLAQSVEHGTLNPRVVGSSPTLGEAFLPRTLINALPQSNRYHCMPKNGDAQLFAQYQVRGYSSVAEHSTADREVTGSTPVVPLELFLFLTTTRLRPGSSGTPTPGRSMPSRLLRVGPRSWGRKHVRRPGIEPGSQEWESCMIPLHQRRKLEMPGIEPGAFHMRSERSTTEPHPLASNVSDIYTGSHVT